ncbi:MAG: ParA family protein [Planctomycetota bacterium]|jgi:chromosome partitioning protein
MKSIAVINQKGGVGKTTSTANLGAGLARFGKRVLLLDLDPQANLTLHLDCQPEEETGTMTQLLAEDVPIKDLISPTTEENMSIVPADTSLGGVEQLLANRIGRETILREALEAYMADAGHAVFDYVLMDCPPSLGVLSANALVSADEVLIPMQTEYFSLQGMAKLTEVISLVQRRLNEELGILFVLPCMVDQRTRLTSEVLSEIERHFGSLVAETRIRPNVKLAEAPSFGLTIFQHAPDSNGAEDYEDLAREVLERHGVKDIVEFRGGITEEEAEEVAEEAAEPEAESALESAPAEREADRPAEEEPEQAEPEQKKEIEAAAPEAEEETASTELSYPIVESEKVESERIAEPKAEPAEAAAAPEEKPEEKDEEVIAVLPTQGPPAPQIPHPELQRPETVVQAGSSVPALPPQTASAQPAVPPPAPLRQRTPPAEQGAEMD